MRETSFPSTIVLQGNGTRQNLSNLGRLNPTAGFPSTTVLGSRLAQVKRALDHFQSLFAPKQGHHGIVSEVAFRSISQSRSKKWMQCCYASSHNRRKGVTQGYYVHALEQRNEKRHAKRIMQKICIAKRNSKGIRANNRSVLFRILNEQYVPHGAEQDFNPTYKSNSVSIIIRSKLVSITQQLQSRLFELIVKSSVKIFIT